MKNTLTRNFTVSSYHVDPPGRARLTAIANFLQETAYTHAHSLGLGFSHLAENYSAWILSRMRISVNQYPKWDEELTVETWPRGVEKLFALRDFRIRNMAGVVIAEAATCWLMVDTKTHRPQRIPPGFIQIETRTDAVFETVPGKIPLPEKMNDCSTLIVKYSDLDVVGHVNNVKFIEWCGDAIDPKLMIQKGIADFKINYISEALPGDEVVLSCSEIKEQSLVINGRNKASGKECFRAKVVIA